jgi:hypothetical protein
MIEVFKTNMDCPERAVLVLAELRDMIRHACISVDLDDCDKIVRVESESIDAEAIIQVLKKFGFECAVLEG